MIAAGKSECLACEPVNAFPSRLRPSNWLANLAAHFSPRLLILIVLLILLTTAKHDGSSRSRKD